jgi:hypothetical protein
LLPERPHCDLPSSPKIGARWPPSRALLQSPPPPKTPLGEFTVARRPRRDRPHRERLAVALGLPRQSRGHGAIAWCVAPPPSPAGAAASRPTLDQWSRLDQEDTPSRFNLSRRSLSRQPPFNKVSWTGGPKRCGLGLRTVDLFPRFFQ